MTKKWIRLLKAVDDKKVGELIQVEEATARAYITAGFAEDGPDDVERQLLEQSRTAFMTELRTFQDNQTQLLRDANQGTRRPQIEATESEDDKKRGAGDFVRQVYIAEAFANRDPEKARGAQERLEKVYKVSRAMNEGSGSTGGYLTTKTIESQVLSVAAEDQVLLPYATPVSLSAAETSYPALDQFQVPVAGQSAFFGGVKIYRKGENMQRTASQPALRQIDLKPTDQTAYSEIGRDLMQDASVAIDGMVVDLIGQAMGWRNDWESLNGSGANQMLGIYNAPAMIQLARQTGGTIKYRDILGMYQRLMAVSQKKARWIAHPYSFSTLIGMQDDQGRLIMLPLQTPSGDAALANAPKWQMLGQPLVFSEKAPVLGQPNDLCLADPSCYLYGTRSGLEIGLSEHFRFDTDVVAIRAKLRNDGQPRMKGPITLADGSSTVSGFVGLI